MNVPMDWAHLVDEELYVPTPKDLFNAHALVAHLEMPTMVFVNR